MRPDMLMTWILSSKKRKNSKKLKKGRCLLSEHGLPGWQLTWHCFLNRKIIGSMGSGAYTFILDRRLKKSPEFQDLENRAQEETNNITPEWTEIIEITKNPTF